MLTSSELALGGPSAAMPVTITTTTTVTKGGVTTTTTTTTVDGQPVQPAPDPNDFTSELAAVTGLPMDYSPGAPVNVCFLTDVEGNFEYLKAFVELSEALSVVTEEEDGSLELELLEGWHFVFGGDSVDKGGAVGGSVRVVRTLVALKKKYPTRCTLILGNRDLNKMRLTSELAPSELENYAAVPGPYWVPERKRVTPAAYLRKLVAARNGVAEGEVDQASIEAANTMANRLRWILRETMGADGEFERRQAELTLINGGAEATEDDTCKSFCDSVLPGGFMRELLELSQLAAIIGDTMYVHGGLIGGPFSDGSTESMGYVPGRPERIRGDVGAWVTALNGWLRDQVDEWIARPLWDATAASASGGASSAGDAYAKERRGGHALIDYVVPGSVPSVVLGNHLDKANMPKQMAPSLLRELNQCGIARVVVGHTPHGSCPTIIKSGAPVGGPGSSHAAVEVVMADTSYSDMEASDNRGRAVSDVQLLRNGSVHVKGRLADASEIDYVLSPLNEMSKTTELVGKLEPLPTPQPASKPETKKASAPGKAFFVKARMTSGELLLCNVSGFVVRYHKLSAEEALAVFLETSKLEPSSPVSQLIARKKLKQNFVNVRRLLAFSKHKSEDEFLEASARTFSSTGDDRVVSVDHDEARRNLVAEIFKLADTDGSGYLSMAEIREALLKDKSFIKLLSGTGNKPGDPEKLLGAMDYDADGKVKLEEMQRFCMDISLS